MRRARTARRQTKKRTEVRADFGGGKCPAGSTVEFHTRGQTLRGKVAELCPQHGLSRFWRHAANTW